ncbi:3-methyl-2-oxobutanoate hydroxymethyltransferase [Alkalimarinus coralli]|uniref:3-methyl-2-oxobutanoate hydroxymethyltransferase n=1 Tax=Alkalimarinus coralli TaxID=2935863 RepID=UPI00202B0F30|nr:3-methyl-2-oxobutanoate hydroxymethyltransferase [Alkalimarinus coralli]
MPTTIQSLKACKEAGEKFAVITSYDATFSHVVASAGVEVILVGDSLGMVLQGHDSTLPVTMEQMIYHTEAVKRGNQGALIMADMPFMSYATPEQALENAALLMQAGAHLIKIEGGDWLCETISMLSERGIPVCAHLGLTPQSVNKLGGYKVQGRESADAEAMIAHAIAQEQAGADVILLECVPSDLAGRLTQSISAPVIGIGAGPGTDGQVLVLHDLLGITPGRRPKFVKNFMEGSDSVEGAIKAYIEAVKSGQFPAPEHTFS